MSHPLSPALLIACAGGVVAERHQKRDGQDRFGDSASAAFVGEVGYRAHFDQKEKRSHWPVPYARLSRELAAFGSARGVLRYWPECGDIALEWHPRRMAHTRASIVIEVLAAGEWGVRCLVYDAVTTSMRGREVKLAPERGDRFLRWADLDPREYGCSAA